MSLSKDEENYRRTKVRRRNLAPSGVSRIGEDDNINKN
jgi:hypothetical protein